MSEQRTGLMTDEELLDVVRSIDPDLEINPAREGFPISRAIEAEARRRAIEEAAQVVLKYLSYDSQRAVSWHEVNDAVAAIRALADKG